MWKTPLYTLPKKDLQKILAWIQKTGNTDVVKKNSDLGSKLKSVKMCSW